MEHIMVPTGHLATTEDEAARVRREIREKLMRGDVLKVTPQGSVVTKNDENTTQSTITVPQGKLADGFHWYERDPELLDGEKQAMQRHFPQFSLDKLSDGRLVWHGTIHPERVRNDAVWHLQAIYANNHPNNSTYGGSIRVYSIYPDLEEIAKKTGGIPHTLRDSENHIYLCTARPEDVKVGQVVTSAASSIAWAVKWIHAFELWLSEDLSTEAFSGHNKI